MILEHLGYLLLVLLACIADTVSASNVSQIFSRPVMARLYESNEYALQKPKGQSGNRVEPVDFASALAGMKPSYVSGVLRFSTKTNLTVEMIRDYNLTRNAVLDSSPDAKFDLELNLNPHGPKAFASKHALVEFMTNLNDKLHPDGWWFDFWSSAQSKRPEWVAAAVAFAHERNQTIGGNVWGGHVPPGSDAVSFVDWPSKGSPYGHGVDDPYGLGFGIAPKEVEKLNNNTDSAVILGHLNCNPQNGDGTESCVYTHDWNTTTRIKYLDYWLDQQSKLNFTYFWNVFFPLCPGAYSFNPLNDDISSTGASELKLSGPEAGTFYDYMKVKATGDNSSSSGSGSGSGGGSGGSDGSGSYTKGSFAPRSAVTASSASMALGLALVTCLVSCA